MVTLSLELVLLFSFKIDIRKCKPFLIETQSISMVFSHCPLSKLVSSLCERSVHRSIRSIRSDLEAAILKGRVATWVRTTENPTHR